MQEELSTYTSRLYIRTDVMLARQITTTKRLILFDLRSLVLIGTLLSFSTGAFIWHFLGLSISALVFFATGISLFLLFIISEPRLLLQGLTLFLLISPVFTNFVEGILGVISKEIILFVLVISLLLQSMLKGKMVVKHFSFGTEEGILAVWLLYLVFQMSRQDIVVGFFGLRSMALYAPLLFLLPTIIRNKQDLAKFRRVLFIGIMFIALVAIVQQIFLGAFMSKLGYESGQVSFRTTMGHLKASSTVGTPGEAGTLIAIFGYVFTIIWLIEAKKTGRKLHIQKVLSLLVLGLGLIATLSRISWLAALLAFMVFSIFFKKAAKMMLLVGLPLVVFINAYFDNFLAEQFLSSFGFGNNAMSIHSTLERLDIMYRAMETFVFRSPMFGHGLGITGAPSLKNAAQLSHGYQVMDNYYLKLIVETGLIGVAIFVIFLASSISQGMVQYRTLYDKELAGLSLGIALGLIIIAITSVASSILESPVLNIYFWILLGLLKVCKALDEKEIKGCPV